MIWEKIRYSLGMKFIAFVLSIICFAATAVCGFVWLYGIDNDYVRAENFYETGVCQGFLYHFGYLALNHYHNDPDLIANTGIFADDYTNVGVEILKVDSDGLTEGEVVAKSFIPENVGYTFFYTDPERYDGEDYAVRLSVRSLDELNTETKNPAAKHIVRDVIAIEYEIYEHVKLRMDKYLPIATVCFVIFVVGLVYLLCAAGHRKDDEEIHSRAIDRIPFDLCIVIMLAIMAASVLGGAYLIDLYFMYPTITSVPDIGFGTILVILTVLSMLAATLFVGLAMTAATRFKLKGWWKNNVSYHFIRLLGFITVKLWGGFKFVCKAIFRGCVNAIKGIPLVWRTALSSTVMLALIIVFAAARIYGLGVIAAVVLGIGMVTVLVLVALQMKRLQKAGQEMASGNENYRVDLEKLHFDFRGHGENLNNIGKGMSIAVSQRMKSERMKTELITNVSHDLKTPLTSIINYVDLLGKEELPEKAQEYVEILERQAARLKKLTEDVVEASKASTGNIQVNLTNTDPFEIINQAAGEYRERLAEKSLDLVIKNESNKEQLLISADGRLLWRAIDNLMNNICKYSQAGTRVYVNLFQRGENAVLSFKNISKDELNVSSGELMERFVRGDESRSSEGSGLGLNIAKSLVELQGGRLELIVDGDLFKVEVSFRELD